MSRKRKQKTGHPCAQRTELDGHSDHLIPLKPVDVARSGTVSDLLHAYTQCSFGARDLGEAADILETMIRKDCFVVVTLSGAMTIAKMGLVLCEMIERGWVDVIVSTGALMAHGFVEGVGLAHFKASPGKQDYELYQKGYDRVYDTYELEKNLDDAEVIVTKVLKTLPPSKAYGSCDIHEALGRHLHTKTKGRAILKAAYEHKVPVYVPAFTDSEIGLDFAIHNRRQKIAKLPPLQFDPFIDLEHYTELVTKQKEMGIFTIGGGAPRNWAQQVAPYLDILSKRIGGPRVMRRFRYGVRVCPEPVHWGGLSGCTYSEGVSWGKFVPIEEGGRYAEVFADATIAWPLLVRAMIERGL